MDKNSTMRILINDTFKQFGITPNILFETRNNNTPQCDPKRSVFVS